MRTADPTDQIVEYARAYERESGSALRVVLALAEVTENSAGEPVTRLTLLLPDPELDTWDVDSIRDLRLALGKRATDLDLPPVSLTLVPESEKGEIEAFS